MTNQIGPNSHNASDWSRNKEAARGIVIIFIYNQQPPFKNR